jgi:Tol biopolymer transport system component
MPTFSPDGQFIAARYDSESGTKDASIFSAADGQLVKQIPVPNFDGQRVQWLSNRTVTYVKSVDGHSDIWSYDLDTGSEKQLTNFKRKQIFAYAWSPDHTSLACQLGTAISNVVTIKSQQ